MNFKEALAVSVLAVCGVSHNAARAQPAPIESTFPLGLDIVTSYVSPNGKISPTPELQVGVKGWGYVSVQASEKAVAQLWKPFADDFLKDSRRHGLAACTLKSLISDGNNGGILRRVFAVDPDRSIVTGYVGRYQNAYDVKCNFK